MCAGRRVNRILLAIVLLIIVVAAWSSLEYIQPSLPLSSTPDAPANPDEAILNLETGSKPSTSPLEDSIDSPADYWSHNRQYAIVIDAGSSGSRVQVYSWLDPAYLRKITPKKSQSILPIIEKGDEKGERWQFKEDPGISTFADKPEAVGTHLKPLLDFASSVIPVRKHKTTPIYLLATAGMRLIPESAQKAILENACRYARGNYPFTTDSGCELHFRVISGELEGIYGWISVNYLKGGFNVNNDPDLNSTAGRKHTYGFLDMGGASTQIAFQPTAEMAREHSDDLTGLKLRFLDGTEVDYKVFVTTFLGFGMNEARRRYVESLIRDAGSAGQSGSKPDATNTVGPTTDGTLKIADPCLPPNLETSDTSHLPANASPLVLTGTGSLPRCLDTLFPLLNKSLPCPSLPCLFNGVHAPITSTLQFLGVSEYWYTSSEVYGLGGAYNHTLFSQTTEQFCATPWSEITRMQSEGQWPNVQSLDRLRLQCFKSAWIMAVLHDGLGVPREAMRVPGDEDEGGKGVDVQGEGATFESVDKIGTFGVSWTLGAILMHVASTIPKKSLLRAGAPIAMQLLPLVLVGFMIGTVGIIFWRARRKWGMQGYGRLEDRDSEIQMRGLDRVDAGGEHIDIISDGGGNSDRRGLEPWHDNARIPEWKGAM